MYFPGSINVTLFFFKKKKSIRSTNLEHDVKYFLISNFPIFTLRQLDTRHGQGMPSTLNCLATIEIEIIHADTIPKILSTSGLYVH